MKTRNFLIVYAASMVEPFNIRTRYASRKCAENAARKMNVRRLVRNGETKAAYVVYSQDEYDAAVKGKGEWKQSICGGKVWVELGTPACCDPSTETYWSI